MISWRSRCAFAAADAALDRALDCVHRHVALAGLFDGEAKAGVHIGVAAALARGYRYLARELRKAAPRLASDAPFWRLIVDQ